MAEREPGFYWVKETADAEGEPAYWNKMVWTFAGEPCSYNDDELAEIGERVVRRSVTAEATLAGSLVDYDLTAPSKYLRFPSFEYWPEPQPITDAQKTGERFLVWHEPKHEPRDLESYIEPVTMRAWFTAFWDDGRWWVIGNGWDDTIRLEDRHITHYLPLPPPPDVKP
jgi:hypothetical protein